MTTDLPTVNWKCYEYLGYEIAKKDAPGVLLSNRSDIKEGDLILVPNVSGLREMAVKQGKYGELYGDDGGHLKAVLSFGEDERKCWTSIGLINPKALDRLVIQ